MAHTVVLSDAPVAKGSLAKTVKKNLMPVLSSLAKMERGVKIYVAATSATAKKGFMVRNVKKVSGIYTLNIMLILLFTFFICK